MDMLSWVNNQVILVSSEQQDEFASKRGLSRQYRAGIAGMQRSNAADGWGDITIEFGENGVKDAHAKYSVHSDGQEFPIDRIVTFDTDALGNQSIWLATLIAIHNADPADNFSIKDLLLEAVSAAIQKQPLMTKKASEILGNNIILKSVWETWCAASRNFFSPDFFLRVLHDAIRKALQQAEVLY